MKFGGTSVADVDRIRAVRDIISSEVKNAWNVVAVVSIAMSPALASSIASLSAVDATDVILNGRKAGIWSMLILPDDVN